jgi:hypothetical protein
MNHQSPIRYLVIGTIHQIEMQLLVRNTKLNPTHPTIISSNVRILAVLHQCCIRTHHVDEWCIRTYRGVQSHSVILHYSVPEDSVFSIPRDFRSPITYGPGFTPIGTNSDSGGLSLAIALIPRNTDKVSKPPCLSDAVRWRLNHLGHNFTICAELIAEHDQRRS